MFFLFYEFEKSQSKKKKSVYNYLSFFLCGKSHRVKAPGSLKAPEVPGSLRAPERLRKTQRIRERPKSPGTQSKLSKNNGVVFSKTPCHEVLVLDGAESPPNLPKPRYLENP